ncbi:MAG: hypothetical protein JSS51_08730 [Planctomycetes bacterium]|nr:hypothetical protein [Planctomycetota bacterium]
MTSAAWIYWIVGAVLGGIGFYLVTWALLSDWLAGHRKHRRCAKCWYDMTAVVGLKCPECGREVKSEKGLHKSRRRWKSATLGIVAAIAGLVLNLATLGQLRGWMYVLPNWAQIRLIDVIGPQPVLFSLGRKKVKGSELSDAAFQSIEHRVVECLEDPSRHMYEKQVLLDCFYMLGRDPSGRVRFGTAAVDYVLSSPNLDIPDTPAIAWSLNLQGPSYVAEQALKQLGPQRDSRLLGRLFRAMIKGPMDDERVRAIADVSQRMPSRMGFGDIDPIMNAHADVFFGRILENLRQAQGEDVFNVLSPMYMLLRSSTTPSTARDEIVKTAAELLGSADPKLRSVCRDVTDPMFGEKILPALPALVSHLSSQVGETRTWAKRVLTRLQLSEGSNKVLLQLLASRFCEQDPQGRIDAIEVFRARVPTPLTPLRANVFACLDTIDEAAALDAALAAFFPDEATGIIWQPQSPGPANPELRALLARMLQHPGARTAAAARWLGEHGDAMTELRTQLTAVASDTSRSPADRAAARDALLHIRDRTNTSIDSLTPLELVAPK